MRRSLLSIFALFAVFLLQAQVPQFSSRSYDGWVYSNPGIELNQNTILANRIVLYTTSQGLHLTLTSPQFTCYAGQVINLHVTWITDQWQNPGFNVSKVALTAALLDAEGVAADSVTCTLTPATVSRTNYLDLSLTVPAGLTSARLRFASWKADVNNSGAVRQIDVQSSLRGDVNRDGEVSLADVNAAIDIVLGAVVDADMFSRADVNHDGEVGIADINAIIDIIREHGS